MTESNYYLTTPIFYVNDAPHIGHAYILTAADVFTRWQRQSGRDTLFLTGTDEHGLKVMRTAASQNYEPKAWADKLVEESWKPVLELLQISNDDFIRTTDKRHMDCVGRFLSELRDKGYISEGEYDGYYCVGCEEFKTDNDMVTGTDKYAGEWVCSIHSRPLERLREKNYFFRMSEFTERLLEFYEQNPDFVEPESARNEVIQFIRRGLADLSISRSSFNWGVPVPWDGGHVVYVWFDALLNYLTAIGYGTDSEQFAKRWPAYHLVGKDILRFHGVIWPAMLMAAGLPLPKKIFAHGWLLVGGEKMSKSKFTGIAPSHITDTFGVDAFRYYFMRVVSFGQDYSFSWEDIAARYQSELANGYGNLACRVTAMYARYFEGRVPVPAELTGAEEVILAACRQASEDAAAAIDAFAPHKALAAVWSLAEKVNGYITEQQPWVCAQEDNRQRLEQILYAALCALGTITVLLSPVMPGIAQRFWQAIGGKGELTEQNIRRAWEWSLGEQVTVLEPPFPRIEPGKK